MNENADEIVRALRALSDGDHDNGLLQMAGKRAVLACAADKITELNDFEHSQCAKLLARIAELETQLTESQRRERAAVEVVRCKDCRLKDTQLCRASKSIKYDLRKEKHTFKTFMEPDGFCSIGERGPHEAGGQ